MTVFMGFWRRVDGWRKTFRRTIALPFQSRKLKKEIAIYLTLHSAYRVYLCVSCEVRTVHSVSVSPVRYGLSTVLSVCSVQFSQQTATVSPHSINWLGSVSETRCVSCEVRTVHTVYLCIPYGSHSKQRLFPHTSLTLYRLIYILTVRH
jgi:hypothetical protein